MSLPASSRTPHAQRGAASVVIAMLLMLILAAAITAGLTISASSVRDSAINEEQTAALFLAESGLERGMNILNTAIAAGAISNSTCSNIAAAGPLNLGRGSFSYVSAISNPAICSGAGCQSCSIVVTGTVGSASRTIRHTVKLATAFGVTGFGGCPSGPKCIPPKPAIKMQLVNPYDVPAAAIFSLAFRRQIPSVNTKVVATACDGCTPEWNVESSNGDPSAGNLAVYKPVAALAATTLVSQTLDQNSDYAEVGGVFPSTSSTAPGITGSYWNDASGGGAGSKTVGTSGTTTGETNSGVASTAPDPDCIAANAAVTGTQQSPLCNSWCVGADTLVFTVAGRSTVISDELTSMRFNTSGSLPQNIDMTRLVHFPNTDGTTPLNSPYGPDIYSEIWYAYNPNYLSSYPVSSAGATSYPNEVKGSIGATVNASFSDNDRTQMNVTTITQGKLSIGDNIASGDGKLDSTVTITAVPSPGPTGIYTFSGNVYTGGSKSYNPTSLAIQSRKLITSGSTIPLSTGNINGTGIAAGTTYDSGPDGSGNYVVDPKQTVAPTIFTQGSSGTTITVPAGSPIPTAGTIIAVYSGNGNFAGGTTVLTTPTANSFTVAAVATPVTDAIICGGTCAFFNAPSSTTSTTQFTITKTAGTDQWAGGFTCLSGVDKVKIFTVTDSSISPGTWQEVVR